MNKSCVSLISAATIIATALIGNSEAVGQTWKCTAKGEFRSCDLGHCSNRTSSVHAESENRSFAEQTAIEICQRNLMASSSVCYIADCEQSGSQDLTPALVVPQASDCPRFNGQRLYRRATKSLKKLYVKGFAPLYQGTFLQLTEDYVSEAPSLSCQAQDNICNSYYEHHREFRTFLRSLRQNSSNRSRLGRTVQKLGKAALRVTKNFCS